MNLRDLGSRSPAPWCWGCRQKYGVPGQRETHEVVVAWLDGDVELRAQRLGCCSLECAQALAAMFVATERPYSIMEVRRV